jgi:hypothetical protein
MMFVLDVTLVSSFTDSERMDMEISVEASDHSTKVYRRDKIPVVVKDGYPQGNVEILLGSDPVGVPIVDSREYGGKIEMAHHYR